MPQFDTSTFISQLFWLLISFSLLYLLISKVCLPRLILIFSQRDAKISEALEKAHRARSEALHLKSEYEAVLASAAKNKSDMFFKATKNISKIIEDRVIEHDIELEKMLKASEKKMAAFAVKSESQIEQIAGESSKLILTNLLAIDINSQLIDETIKNIRAKG
jgi:F-type H+-transporting ATPase subunit b